MTRINTNVSSLVARNTLGRSNAALEQALTRLSTGLRINTGKDDPAGLIASENLRSDITSIRRAISNTDRANQVIATADSALGQVSNLLNDIRGLVTESANAGALSDAQIAANQLQVDSSLEALNRIAQTTTFQGRRLLDGSLDFVTNTSDSDFSNVQSLKIDQANLGATGTVPVSLSISTAATRAQVNVANVPGGSGTGVAASTTITLSSQTGAGTAAAGTVDFTVQTAAAQAASGNVAIDLVELQASGTVTIDSTNSASFTLTAVALGDAAGDEGNGAKSLVIVNDTTEGAVYDANTNTLTVTMDITGGNNTVTYLAGLISAGSDFTVSGITDGADTVTASNTGAGTLAGGRDASTETIAVTSVAGDNNISITIAEGNGIGATPSVSGDATNGYVITVDDAGSTTIADIATAIQSISEVATAVYSGSATYEGADDAAPGSPTVLTGGDDAQTATQSIDIASLATSAGGNLSLTFAVGGTAGVAAGSGAGEYTVTYTAGSSLNDILTLLENGTITELDATATGLATGAVGTNVITAGPSGAQAISGYDAPTTGNDVITLTAANVGTAGSGRTVTINETSNSSLFDAGTGVGVAVDTNGNVVISLNSAATAINVSDIVAALEATTEYTASLTTSGGSGVYNSTTQAPPTVANTAGGEAAGGLAGAVVFELAGLTGSEVLSFGAGTSISQLVTGINLVRDATGVEAVANGTTLELRSTEYGSSALVDLKVISEGSGSTPSGIFSTATATQSRDTGTDIVATVNGIAANGKGNTLQINTATLDLTSTITAGFTGSIDFTITGGGALFQLGPDVVSNQQARLGIGSVNTARLGGVSGKLFQLGTGNDASLSTDTNVAARIVEEAIDQVTSLRGRLGAFQRTTLETNKQALNDTLTNLTEAESSIRDADFAEESAQLTRAQILVQSGTTVLQIANQNPQNVLALLRG
ncbi:MAG: hypothetical protein KF688_04925 [Pirellulales bacterium]|nr:hypothetical protein [Pirellulales bacterium]